MRLHPKWELHIYAFQKIRTYHNVEQKLSAPRIHSAGPLYKVLQKYMLK